MAERSNSSPAHAKMSHASAMSLGLMGGRMYRGAVNRCVNLLVHYPEGCSANCSYCGLAKKRPGTYEEKSFIHVDWPIYSMNEIIEAINRAPGFVRRICISMITNGKCVNDTVIMSEQLCNETRLPLSILISPTILSRQDLVEMKNAGVDKIGIAIDLATPELFDKFRGTGVSGPHKWDQYWQMFDMGLEIFQRPNVGAHLMVGMGETEKEMISLVGRLWEKGIMSHLFSFFAEKGSVLSDRPSPPWPTYLRIQMARYLIEEGISSPEKMTFDQDGHLIQFGITYEDFFEALNSGTPFMTSGCLDEEGCVACNRPFGNCLPDEKQWNYPYLPNKDEAGLIKKYIFKIE